MKFDSICIHGVKKAKNENFSHCAPIYATSTFEFENVEHCLKAFDRKENTYLYTRWGNPNTKTVEDKVAALEGFNLKDKRGKPIILKAQLFSSGMGAISTLLMSLLKPGDKILTHGSIYGGTAELMDTILPEIKIERIIVDLKNLNKAEETVKKNPSIKIIYFESPANPTIDCYDITGLSSIAQKYGILTVFDNTVCTPYLQQPFKYGVDYVVHSTTKYLNGHGTGIGGILIGKNLDFMRNRLFHSLKLIGTNSNAFDAWLINLGLNTLPIRMDKHCSNAKEIAIFLRGHKKIKKVNYLGFEDHPQHRLAKKQMRNFGALISFEVKGGLNAGIKLMNSVKLCKLAPSLGTVDTLIIHPASMTHAGVAKTIRENYGITDSLIRLSVGIENSTDIIEDLKGALLKLK